MLRKSKSDPIPVPQEPRVHPASVTATDPRPVEKTVIGQHISIEGDIKGSEDLVIQGSVKGSIVLPDHHLTIGPKGQVEAEISVANVTISGTLMGNIKASGKVQITKDADFMGEIKAKRISVEDGAYLKAAIELEREAAPASAAGPGKAVKEARPPLAGQGQSKSS